MLYAAISPQGNFIYYGQGRDDTKDKAILKGFHTQIIVPAQVLQDLNGVTGIIKKFMRVKK